VLSTSKSFEQYKIVQLRLKRSRMNAVRNDLLGRCGNVMASSRSGAGAGTGVR
jgi:hypothetical protein